MLQEVNGAIVEKGIVAVNAMTISGTVGTNNAGAPTNWTGDYWNWTQPVYYYHSYPVYVCTDKMKKAIEILKALQADKQIECKSVAKFIELVEKIAGLLLA